jgi:predicted O-linked N-acetylglucosamine transferase (SPINDLY family)
LCQQGLGWHQKGQLAQAKAAYEQVLTSQPKHFDALHFLGVIALQCENPALAVALIDQAIESNPNHASAYLNRGFALQELQRLDEALASYDRAIAIRPDFANAFNNRGNILLALQRLDEALASYDQAVAIRPDYAQAFSNRGTVLQKLERLNDALTCYDQVIAIQPDYADAFSNRGSVLKDLKRLEEALASYDQAVAIRPDDAKAFYNRGIVLQDLKRLDDALTSYNQAVVIQPDFAQAFYNRGITLQEIKRLDDALASFDKAIAIKPDYAEAFNNRGHALQAQKRLDDALASYDKAIAIRPDYAQAFNNRGTVLQELKRVEDALASYDKAIAIQPDYAQAFNNRGTVLQELKRLDDALASLDQAITIKPDYAEAFNNRGTVLQVQKRLDEALGSYDQAIAIKPDYAEAFLNRGLALQELKRLDEALVSYDQALAIKPDLDFIFGFRLGLSMKLCDWRGISLQLPALEEAILKGQKAIDPFSLLGLIDNPQLQLRASQMYVETMYPPGEMAWNFEKRRSDKKIRIGYYSADLHNHPITYLTAELFEAHDSQLFEFYCFSFGPDSKDEMRQRVSRAFENFYDVADKSDFEIVRISRQLEIDIAVDLNGFTSGSRTKIFAERCAPIQVNYLGYSGTTGASYFDYIIADKTLIRQESQQHYSEKIVYLPNSYMVNDSKRKISDRVFTRQEGGLPETGFVFCCFNNYYKILPATFDGWMRILQAVKGSVLWLSEGNPIAVSNLRKEAEARGVDSSRLIFAKRMDLLQDHLARHRLADLFIDTLPYNAHTTTSDALWAGLPVLTLQGKAFAARVAASLLTALDLPELITETQEQYEARAIELAKDPVLLNEIKNKLAQNRLTSTLFNGQIFSRHVEAAFTEMYQCYVSGQAPDHITIDA